jgi:hypothetical protein
MNGNIDYNGLKLKQPVPSKQQRSIDEDHQAADVDEDSDDDVPLVHPKRLTRSSKTVLKPSTTVAPVPRRSTMKKPSKRSDVVIDLNESSSDHPDQHGGGGDSDSGNDDQHRGTKRKLKRKDGGGMKKRVHIISSSDEEQDTAASRGDAQRSNTVTYKQDAKKSNDDTFTIPGKEPDHPSTSSPQPLQDVNDNPFIGQYRVIEGASVILTKLL